MEPTILFLPGMRIKNNYGFNIDDPNDAEDLPNDVMYDYETLPDTFKNVKEWPISCGLHCSNCDLTFCGRPWFIPLCLTFKIDNSLQEQSLERHLVFCTPFCASYYYHNVNDKKIIDKWDIDKLFKELFFRMTGKKVIYIPDAPEKTVMIQYKGSSSGITPHEYRQVLESLWEKIIYYT
jgi:hypothetical protein